MEPIITINEYPIGWEWLDKVPLEDFTWLIEIFATMTDNTDTYDLDTFIPGNPWEHYCKYELHKHPFHTNEKEYNYFLDTFTSTDKYEQIMEIYANPR